MAKILGIDLGEKRVGLALTDELEIIASGYGYISREKAISFILETIENEHVELIVLGLPKLPSGGLGSQANDIQKFAKELATKTDIPIEFENEVLSSAEAENRLKEAGRKIKDKGEIDEMAAMIILESFIRERN